MTEARIQSSPAAIILDPELYCPQAPFTVPQCWGDAKDDLRGAVKELPFKSLRKNPLTGHIIPSGDLFSA